MTTTTNEQELFLWTEMESVETWSLSSLLVLTQPDSPDSQLHSEKKGKKINRCNILKDFPHWTAKKLRSSGTIYLRLSPPSLSHISSCPVWSWLSESFERGIVYRTNSWNWSVGLRTQQTRSSVRHTQVQGNLSSPTEHHRETLVIFYSTRDSMKRQTSRSRSSSSN